jgi:PTH1 family peptidyl-tRNA hydrolase
MPLLRTSVKGVLAKLMTGSVSDAGSLPGPHMLIGLGNPGPEYSATRHNAGFLAIDALVAELGGSYWKAVSGALVCECRHHGDPLVLAKPQRFMNLSGQPVKSLLAWYSLRPDDILVIHDELDLPDGTLRLKVGGGHAGHKGIRSINDSIGPDYARLRVGIGRPPGQMPADRFVLQRLSNQMLAEFQVSIAQAAAIALEAVEQGVSATMNHRNGKA